MESDLLASGHGVLRKTVCLLCQSAAKRVPKLSKLATAVDALETQAFKLGYSSLACAVTSSHTVTHSRDYQITVTVDRVALLH